MGAIVVLVGPVYTKDVGASPVANIRLNAPYARPPPLATTILLFVTSSTGADTPPPTVPVPAPPWYDSIQVYGVAPPRLILYTLPSALEV